MLFQNRWHMQFLLSLACPELVKRAFVFPSVNLVVASRSLYTLIVRVKISLKLKFVFLTIIAFLVLGFSLFFFINEQIKSFFLNAAKNDFVTHVQNHAEGNLSLEKPVSLKLSGQYIEYAKTIESLESIEDVRILDSNGIIIYSENSTEIGQSLLEDGSVQTAINGESSLRNIDFSNKKATAYAPIKSKEGNTRGIVVATTALADAFNYINHFTRNLIYILSSIFVIFFGTVYWIFSDSERTLGEQDRSIIDKSKALEEEQQLDEAIMSSIAESLIVINKNGQIMLFNPEAERITGHKSSNVEYRLYKKIIPFIDKDGKEISKNPITECLNDGKRIQVSIKDGYFIKDTNKKKIPISIHAAPIFEKNRSVRGVVATIQDVTVEKELDKVKDEFVYVVAHELGNPIFALDGYLTMLEEAKNFNAESKKMITTAKSINQELSNLVNDLLEVIRSESGQLKIDVLPIELEQITKMVVENSKFKAKEKNITISYKPSKYKVMGDAQKIQEVVTNLVDNAIKYTPEGGKIEVWHDTAEEMIITHVQDNGLGMNTEALSHLFEKFYRVKTEKTKGIPGTGLGLFICRQIVEKCGGKIWAESEEGKGSIFSFSLIETKK